MVVKYTPNALDRTVFVRVFFGFFVARAIETDFQAARNPVFTSRLDRLYRVFLFFFLLKPNRRRRDGLNKNG